MAVSIREQLAELEEMNEILKETRKKKEAPRRSFLDKLKGKKRLDKGFRLPKKLKAGIKKKIKQNYALVLYIRNNGYCNFQWAPIVNDLIYIKDSSQYHAATADYIMKYIERNKIYPMIIQPEVSLTPFSLKDYTEKTKDEGAMAAKQKVLLDIESKSQLKSPMRMPGKTLLFIIIGIVIALYLVSQFMN